MAQPPPPLLTTGKKRDSDSSFVIMEVSLVQAFYSLTLDKLQHKLFHLFLIQKRVLYNILKVLRNPVGGKYRNFKI